MDGFGFGFGFGFGVGVGFVGEALTWVPARRAVPARWHPVGESHDQRDDEHGGCHGDSGDEGGASTLAERTTVGRGCHG
ncbi:hypothetical protein [Streptomyces sp. F001]|uniref:hypothetical protein n=1 Tax=Streptomyces sp. F001 TaxID=1510026 RepID=UPI0023EA6007|nr:hypothetical protein [Streptomyces sp. F001]